LSAELLDYLKEHFDEMFAGAVKSLSVKSILEDDDHVPADNTLVRYKNSYHPNTYAYRVMNSLLDIVKNTFVELNK
jgi:hypothetical protein